MSEAFERYKKALKASENARTEALELHSRHRTEAEAIRVKVREADQELEEAREALNAEILTQ